MFNPRCPNCSYMLTLLKHRRKYKCSKCGRLFLQKEIESKTFKNWNKLQRELDIQSYEQDKIKKLIQLRELTKSIKLLFGVSPRYVKPVNPTSVVRKKKLEKVIPEEIKLLRKERKIFKNFRLLFKERRSRTRLTREEKLQRKRENYWKNREKELEKCRIYRENNKEKRILYTKKWVEENKERRKQWLKSHINKNKVKYKQIKRLGYWRAKQVKLAQQELRGLNLRMLSE